MMPWYFWILAYLTLDSITVDIVRAIVFVKVPTVENVKYVGFKLSIIGALVCTYMIVKAAS